MLLVADYAKLLAQAFTDLVLLNWGEFSKHWKENMDAVAANANESLGQVDDVLEKARLQYKALLDQANETNKSLKPPPAIRYGNQDALEGGTGGACRRRSRRRTPTISRRSSTSIRSPRRSRSASSRRPKCCWPRSDQREEFQAAELQQATRPARPQPVVNIRSYQDELTKIQAEGDGRSPEDHRPGGAGSGVRHWKAAADQISSAFDSQLTRAPRRHHDVEPGDEKHGRRPHHQDDRGRLEIRTRMARLASARPRRPSRDRNRR